MSLPYRVSLPHPLPENVVVFPGALDRLVLHLEDRGACVSSEDTSAEAPFAEALRDRRLWLRDDRGDDIDLPVTAVEAAGLAPYARIAAAWDGARESRDLHALMSVVAAVHKLEAPWWLDVRIKMPGRQPCSLTA